jgi:hypothetical protein
MAIIDDLLAHPGLYLGVDIDTLSHWRGAARIVVTPLPGRAGVTLDYEVINTDSADRSHGHVEHTVIGRTDDGGTVMVIGHTHGEGVAILRETDPGVFEPVSEGSPYPLKIVISMPEPGRIRHAWWYGSAGEVAVEHDVAELTLAT